MLTLIAEVADALGSRTLQYPRQSLRCETASNSHDCYASGGFVRKRILVVAHHRPLRATRVTILEKAGYSVASVSSDDDAMAMLETEKFDLILIESSSARPEKGLDQRLREKYPDLLTLKVESNDLAGSIFPSRITDSEPSHVLAALNEMLGED